MLAQRGVHADRVAVALNEQMVDRARYDSMPLQPGDSLEFLYYLAGGKCRCA